MFCIVTERQHKQWSMFHCFWNECSTSGWWLMQDRWVIIANRQLSPLLSSESATVHTKTLAVPHKAPLKLPVTLHWFYTQRLVYLSQGLLYSAYVNISIMTSVTLEEKLTIISPWCSKCSSEQLTNANSTVRPTFRHICLNCHSPHLAWLLIKYFSYFCLIKAANLHINDNAMQ